MNVYVTPPGVPGAPSTGTGTSEDPFTSIADGIKAAQNAGPYTCMAATTSSRSN
jgi:hypothetical protein